MTKEVQKILDRVYRFKSLSDEEQELYKEIDSKLDSFSKICSFIDNQLTNNVYDNDSQLSKKYINLIRELSIYSLLGEMSEEQQEYWENNFKIYY